MPIIYLFIPYRQTTSIEAFGACCIFLLTRGRATILSPFFPFQMKTYLAKKGEITPKWHVIDADGQVLGRLSVRIANLLRGRHRPTYTPNADTGDGVIVINSSKVVLTGKKEEGKDYMFFTGWVGNEKHRSAGQMRERHPEFLIEHAVKGMLPKNRLASQQLKRLKIYAGPTHKNEAQKPEPLAL